MNRGTQGHTAPRGQRDKRPGPRLRAEDLATGDYIWRGSIFLIAFTSCFLI